MPKGTTIAYFCIAERAKATVVAEFVKCSRTEGGLLTAVQLL